MTDFTNQQIPPPANWQDFQNLCADLWRNILANDSVQLNGRSGQRQHGVDIFGRRNDGIWVGIQCKTKDARLSSAVSVKELRKEVKEAKNFKPKLMEFIFATTAPNDVTMQEEARLLTTKHQESGLFSVEVMSWDELQRRIANFPDLINKYYPNQGSNNKATAEKLDKILELSLANDATQQKMVSLLESAKSTTTGVLNPSYSQAGAGIHDEINAEIDSCLELYMANQPKTALTLLESLKLRVWGKASNQIKFRIETNIAAANLVLGNTDIAADGFLSAINSAPKEEKALTNVAFAHLLKGDSKKARDWAKNAIAAFPKSEKAFSLLVASSVDDVSVGIPESLIPQEMLESGDICYSIAHFYRKRGQLKTCIPWISKAYESDKTSIEVRSSYAALLLEMVAENNSATYGNQRNETQVAYLEEATAMLRNLWTDLKGSEIAKQHYSVVQNLINALRINENYKEALKTVEQALDIFGYLSELIRLRALLLTYLDRIDEARSFLKAHLDTHYSELAPLYAEVLLRSEQPDGAIAQIEKCLSTEDREDYREELIGLKIRALAKTKNKDNVNATINQELQKCPESIVLRSSAALALSESGYNDLALEQIRQAASSFDTALPFSKLDYAADVAFQLKDYESALSLYRHLLTEKTDSQILRRTLVCLHELDKRVEALIILDELSPAIRNLSFYRRMAAAIFVKVGKYNEALKEMEQYLQNEPDDLNVRLNWISILLRQDKNDLVEQYLNSALDFKNASPEDQMQLAHLFNHFKHTNRAIELAYYVRKANPHNPDIYLGYISLFLVGKAASGLNEPAQIDKETAFTLLIQNGAKETYYLLPEGENVQRDGEILSIDPIAKQVIGKRIGDRVLLQRSQFEGEEEWEVVEIISKYVHLLRRSQEEFRNRFPSDNRFLLVSIAGKHGEEICLEPILNSLSIRRDYENQVIAMYQTESLPIAAVAKMLGRHPIEAWQGLLAKRDIEIHCCYGHRVEREQAFQRINQNQSSVLVEPLTLLSLIWLGVQDAVANVLKGLAVTQSGLDLIYSLIAERRRQSMGEGYANMSKQGEQYYYTEVSTEQIKADLAQLELALEWAKDNCEIIPAIGRKKVSLQYQSIKEVIGLAFYDTLIAASDTSKLLLSDDLHLRKIGQELWGVEGIWSQSALIKANANGMLSFTDYCKAVGWMIEARINFTTISSSVLFEIQKSEDWTLNDRYHSIISVICDSRTEFKSALVVLLEFIISLWNTSIPVEDKEKQFYELLSGITKGYTNIESPPIIEPFVRVVLPYLSDYEQNGYLPALRKWCAGHFVKTNF